MQQSHAADSIHIIACIGAFNLTMIKAELGQAFILPLRFKNIIAQVKRFP
jgi:hypothetical protein